MQWVLTSNHRKETSELYAGLQNLILMARPNQREAIKMHFKASKLVNIASLNYCSWTNGLEEKD